MKENICLALGFFDSVHCGHRVIIKRLKGLAQSLGVKPMVSTFSDGFSDKSGLGGKLVYTFEERKRILSELGIDDILLFDFDENFKSQSPLNFLQGLRQKYNLSYIVCGYDYRFGRKGAGDTDTLKKFCNENNIKLEIIDKVCIAGERVSSSKIKEFLIGGDIENANRFLSDKYFVCASVVKGRGEGRFNNIPTANITVSGRKLLPKSGVYATKTEAFGKLWTSVTNIGSKPTYDDFSFGVETFIDGFEKDIYGQEIRVIFYKYLREIRKFADKAELAKQINADINQSREVLC